MQDQRIHELMDAMRGRYKAILAMLGLPDVINTGTQAAADNTAAAAGNLNF